MARTHFDTPPEDYDAQRSGHLGLRRIELFSDAIEGGTAGGQPIRSVLEIGSATGFVLRALAERHPDVRFTGVELDARLVDFARSAGHHPNIAYHHGGIGDFSSDQPVDLVLSADVIHHFHHHAQEFAAVRSLLRTGGRWIAVEPNIWQAYVTFTQERMKRSGYDEDHFRPRILEPLLRDAGFDVSSRRYQHLLPAAVRQAPPWARRLELAVERFRLIGGSVVYELTAR